MCVFVGSCLATKVFIGNLPAMGREWVIMKLDNDERGQLLTNQLLDHASRAPQLMSCSECVCVYVCVYTCASV